VTDTQETLQSALADLTRRVAAFEKAQKQADVEPDQLTEYDLGHLAGGSALTYIQNKAYARLVRLESVYADAQAELARLREGLKARESDITSLELESWGDDNDFEYSLESMRDYIRSQCRTMAREIQRHRALVTK
jgi:hypothetical protein